ncbi:hypothetical protein BJV78DRAFT_1155713 [Lactifluus subvellereus]|nr:hypothetical protein BJV78DRAFT_1155713 [Lactifluus subvellereus]
MYRAASRQGGPSNYPKSRTTFVVTVKKHCVPKMDKVPVANAPHAPSSPDEMSRREERRVSGWNITISRAEANSVVTRSEQRVQHTVKKTSGKQIDTENRSHFHYYMARTPRERLPREEWSRLFPRNLLWSDYTIWTMGSYVARNAGTGGGARKPREEKGGHSSEIRDPKAKANSKTTSWATTTLLHGRT